MLWTGRFDGDDPLYQRIFQRVSLEKNYDAISTNDFALHGFAVDEGVKRNKGNIGAKTLRILSGKIWRIFRWLMLTSL